VDFGDFPLTGADMTVDGVPAAIGPRRAVLDELLVRAAADAGAEVREGFAVHELTRDGERVTGLLGRAALRDAELLAETIAAERPLCEYEERRNEATLADFGENFAMGRRGPVPPAVLAAREARRHDPGETRRYLMAREGMICPVASTV
jgi:hypothetical protein